MSDYEFVVRMRILSDRLSYYMSKRNDTKVKQIQDELMFLYAQFKARKM